MRQRTLKVERLGRVEYGAALDIQKQTERAVLTDTQANTLLLLEHPHTLTLGRRAAQNGIIAPEMVLRERGVTVFETNRGGKVTYHGLGQIVGYPIINLSPDREDVHRYVRDLEEVLIRTMQDYDIEAFRIEGLTGVHTDRKSTRLNSSHGYISYAVFCLKNKTPANARSLMDQPEIEG